MNDTVKKQFADAGYICVRLKPVMYRIRGEYDFMDIFPLLGKYKHNGSMYESEDLLKTARQIVQPYEPCVTPALLEHREQMSTLIGHIEYRVLKRQ